MPKVPSIREASGTVGLATPSVGRVVPTGNAQLGGALAELGGEFAKIADDVAREEAALQVSAWEDALEAKKTELGWDDQKGLFHKKDERAYASGDDSRAMVEFRTFGESSIGKLPSPRARELAASKLGGHVASWNRSIESYVGEQRARVKASTYERKLGLLADLIQGDPLNSVAIDARKNDLDQLARDLSIPETVTGEASIRIEKLRAEAQIDRALKLGDVDTARSFFDQSKEKLGEAAGRIAERIEGEETRKTATRLTDLAIKEAPSPLNPEGKWVDEAKARRRFGELLDARPELTAERRQVAEATFERAILAARATREADVVELWKRIRGASAERGLVGADPGDLKTLERWDGELYARLWREERNARDDASARFDRNLARRDAAAARAARDADRLWVTRYLNLPTKERAELDVEREFVGRVSPLGMAEIGRLKTAAIEALGRGDDVTEAQFLRYAKDAAGPTLSRGDEERFTAAALLAWEAARSAKGGELDPTERARVVGDVLLGMKTEPRLGGLYTTEVAGFRSFGPGSTIPAGIVKPPVPMPPPKWLRGGTPGSTPAEPLVAPTVEPTPREPSLSSVEPPPAEPMSDIRSARAARARELREQNPAATQADILEALRAEGLY